MSCVCERDMSACSVCVRDMSACSLTHTGHADMSCVCERDMSACPGLISFETHFSNQGNTEGTNIWKLWVGWLCIHVCFVLCFVLF